MRTSAPKRWPRERSQFGDQAAIAARLRLQKVLDKLNPAGGILDMGDGTGKHAGKGGD